MPTRLIDFSWNPYVAAYFAASDAIGAQSSELAVWAFDIEQRDKILPAAAALGRLRIVTVPAETDSRLAAQHALFVVRQAKPTSLAALTTGPVDHTTLEDMFVGGLPRVPGAVPPLRRITCPTSEAPKILRLLHGLGVHAATVFGGYSGAAASCREIARWDVPVYPKAFFGR